MKVIIAILILNIVIFKGYSQEKNKVSFRVEKISDTFNVEKDLNVILKIINNSDYPLIVPTHYLFISLNDSTDFYYDILYSNGKKVEKLTKKFKNFSINHPAPIDINKNKYIVIDKDSSTQIHCNLYHNYFNQTGKYQIRFYFRASKFNQCISKNIATDWITVYVKNPELILR